MKADTAITITPAMVQAWVDEAGQLERKAAALIEEAKEKRADAQAAARLLGISEPKLEAADLSVGNKIDQATLNLTEKMAEIANASEKPLTKGQMKSRLMNFGFSEDRLGSYFYTCVARLKTKKRITVMPDGKIWRAGA
jgi:hypothetical protein